MTKEELARVICEHDRQINHALLLGNLNLIEQQAYEECARICELQVSPSLDPRIMGAENRVLGIAAGQIRAAAKARIRKAKERK